MKRLYTPTRLLVSLFVILFLMLLFLLWTERDRLKNQEQETFSQTTPNQYQEKTQEEVTPTEDKTIEPVTKETEEKLETIIPPSAYLDVPFLVQAPNANWDQRHEEACEEASLVMVNHYINGTKVINPDADLNGILTYQEQNGYKADVTVSELNQIAKDYYSLKTGRVVANTTKEKIQREVADGKPVIIPAAGKLLPNPNFRNGGPNYHMLVVKGYDEKGFITNDPGTRLGKDFRYEYNDLINAIHDWNEPNILQGEKNILIFD